MATEEPKDPLKSMDWKTVSSEAGPETSTAAATTSTTTSGPVTKKRLPRKVRQIPDYYFLPRRPWPQAIAVTAAYAAAGIGAGMLIEAWINKKMEEDGGVVWEMGKTSK
ncbi:hypothetical protein QJS10_CPB19g00410 [Acorus calamus]|uniref:Uncharacterized protein n=1 Tax=Acorus calamus TaxID=4465 RepID=A0AAV9CH31_ACOCL|nr:hypothetical protein QJS10_CPB19g00410 [Acorus calamus]